MVRPNARWAKWCRRIWRTLNHGSSSRSAAYPRKLGLTDCRRQRECLIGISGCGKSLTCKAISTVLQCPLFRVDLGALKSSLSGKAKAISVKCSKSSRQSGYASYGSMKSRNLCKVRQADSRWWRFVRCNRLGLDMDAGASERCVCSNDGERYLGFTARVLTQRPVR